MNKHVYIAAYGPYFGQGTSLEEAKDNLDEILYGEGQDRVEFNCVTFFLAIPQKVKQIIIIEDEENEI